MSDLLRIDAGDEGFDLVVAQRPEEPRRDGDRGGRRLRVALRIEAEEPDAALAVFGGEPRREARGLRADQRPAAGRRRCIGDLSFDDLLDSQVVRVDPVREPARIRNLVDRVDILRAHVRRRVAPLREHVQEQIRDQIDVPRRDFRGVGGLGLARQRIVAVELRAGAADGERGERRHRKHDDERGEPAAGIRAHHQKAAAPENVRCQPSEPRLTSMRSGVWAGPCSRTPTPQSCSSPTKLRSSRRLATLPAS